MIRSIGCMMLAVTAAACATPSQPGGTSAPATEIQVQTNREFDIGSGQEAHIQGTPIVVRFRSVSNDSRCPTDVQCVWAGNAVVGLTLTQGEGPSTEISLNTGLDPKVTKLAAYTIKLVGLKPAPKAGKPITPAAYVATLEVILE
ncbi:MAG: hypothetical protein ABI556_12420 [Gemmatimonadales bacterium]